MHVAMLYWNDKIRNTIPCCFKHYFIDKILYDYTAIIMHTTRMYKAACLGSTEDILGSLLDEKHSSKSINLVNAKKMHIAYWLVQQYLPTML